MKQFYLRFSVFFIVLFTFVLQAQASVPDSMSPFSFSLVQSMRTTLERCLVRPYGYQKSGELVFGHYQSVCPEVVREGHSATVSLEVTLENGTSTETWELQLIGSEFTDGGDLWDIALWDHRAHLLLESQRVLTFGDPFEAWNLLTGAKPSGRVHDPRLDELFR